LAGNDLPLLTTGLATSSFRKVYDAGEALNAQSSRYDYTFTCKAKQEVVLSDIIELNGRIRLPASAGVDPTSAQTFLRLRAPAA
jgi:hypothetical protein